MAGKDSAYFCDCFPDYACFYLIILCVDREIPGYRYDSSGDGPGSFSWNYGLYVIYGGQERKRNCSTDDNLWFILHDPL